MVTYKVVSYRSRNWPDWPKQRRVNYHLLKDLKILIIRSKRHSAWKAACATRKPEWVEGPRVRHQQSSGCPARCHQLQEAPGARGSRRNAERRMPEPMCAWRPCRNTSKSGLKVPAFGISSFLDVPPVAANLRRLPELPAAGGTPRGECRNPCAPWRSLSKHQQERVESPRVRHQQFSRCSARCRQLEEAPGAAGSRRNAERRMPEPMCALEVLVETPARAG